MPAIHYAGGESIASPAEQAPLTVVIRPPIRFPVSPPAPTGVGTGPTGPATALTAADINRLGSNLTDGAGQSDFWPWDNFSNRSLPVYG